MNNKYKVTFDIASGMVTGIEQVFSSSVELILDDEFVNSILLSGKRYSLVNDELVEDTTPVFIEENIVPSRAEAERLGLDPSVGVSANILE